MKEIPVLERERLRQRVHMVSHQTRAALSTLLHQAELTELGRSLVEGMQRNLDIHSENLPDLAEGVAERIQQSMQQHRDSWLQQHHGVDQVASMVVEKKNDDLAHEPLAPVLRALNISVYTVELLPQLLRSRFFEDMILMRIVKLHDEENLEGIQGELLLPGTFHPILTPLVHGHVAYVQGAFTIAMSAYAQLVHVIPYSAYAWSLVAFAMRHSGDSGRETAQQIFRNLGTLMLIPAGSSEEASRLRNSFFSMQPSEITEIWVCLERLVDRAGENPRGSE
jgi:hypothetical protein